MLDGNSDFANALSHAFEDQGVLVARKSRHESFTDGLSKIGFKKILQYDEAHSRLPDSRDFVVALKDPNVKARWYRNEAQVQLDIHRRLRPSMSGSISLNFYDGATYMSYQLPNRVVEDEWCRSNEEECQGGHGFDPFLVDQRESVSVRQSKVANGERGVFAAENIHKDSYLGTVYQPFQDRHYQTNTCKSFKALNDIRKGEELLDNYIVYGGPDGNGNFDYIVECSACAAAALDQCRNMNSQGEQRTWATKTCLRLHFGVLGQ